MKRLIFAVLILSASAFAQTVGTYSGPTIINGVGQPIAGASVAIVTSNPCGSSPSYSSCGGKPQGVYTGSLPPSNLATVFTDITGGFTGPNPLTTDGLGNWTVYAASGSYWAVVYGYQITPQVQTLTINSGLAVSGTQGALCYFTANPLVCDPNAVTNGSGALSALTGTFNSVTTGGSGAGTWTSTEGTGIPNPSAGKDTIYVSSVTHAISCLNSAGAQCPPNPVVSVKPVTGDEIQYISTNANDSSDGFSWGTGKATWAAAKTFCSTHNCLVAFSPGISTTDCPDGTATILTVDYRSLTTPCGNNAVSWNTQGSGSSISRSILRLGLLYSAPSSSSAAGIGFADYTGNLTSANGQSLEGLNGTSFMTGTLTNVPGSIFVNGFEGSAEVQTSGTGVTLPDVRGMTANITLLTGNTSSVTKASSIYGQACSVAGTGTIGNCVSGYFEQPTAGTAINESLHADGESSFGGPPGSARVYTDRLGSGDLQTTAVAFATLTGAITCNSTNEGAEKAINDSTVNTVGSTISGSGSNHVKAYCNGTNWVVGEGGTSGSSGVSTNFWNTPWGGASNVTFPTANTTKLFAVNITTSLVGAKHLYYHISTADNTANVYDLGLYNASGTLVCDIGATAGTTFAPSTGDKSIAIGGGSGCTTTAGQRYYIALTDTVQTATITGQTSIWSPACGVAPATGSTTTGGALNGTVTFSADAASSCTVPNIALAP